MLLDSACSSLTLHTSPQCPYRHSEAARSSATVCPQWLERQCSNIHCPMKHPGGKHKPSSEFVTSGVTKVVSVHATFTTRHAVDNETHNYCLCFCLLANPPSPCTDPQVVMPGMELVQCGGRCGDVTCAAHFPSSEALQQHIKVSRLPSCRYVSVVLPNECLHFLVYFS